MDFGKQLGLNSGVQVHKVIFQEGIGFLVHIQRERREVPAGDRKVNVAALSVVAAPSREEQDDLFHAVFFRESGNLPQYGFPDSGILKHGGCPS